MRSMVLRSPFRGSAAIPCRSGRRSAGGTGAGALLASVLLASVFLASTVLCTEAPAAETSTWKAGVARGAITPDEPVWLAGYAHRDRPAEGAIHDLWVKALALEDARGRRAVLVTSDILGFPKKIAETIAREVETKHGIARARLLLTSSHTHSGPVLERALMPCYPLDDAALERIGRYSRRLEREVVETVGRALAALAPATLWAASGKASFAANRRNNREAEVPRLLAEGAELRGPVDHDVPVLAARGADGKLLAVAFGYACHNTNLDGYLWCGDYAGFAQIALEKRHHGATAMFWSGCGADQNPLPRRSLERCEGYGNDLAAGVDAALGGSLRPIGARLDAAFRLEDLAFAPLPARAEIAALLEKGNVYEKRWARMVLGDLDAGRGVAASYPLPVQVWRLGGTQLWIALGGEVVVDYALRFKGEYGEHTWVAGYSNDVMAYIPSRRVQEEGGYEAGAMQVYGLPAPGWAPGVEDRVAAAVKALVEETRGE